MYLPNEKTDYKMDLNRKMVNIKKTKCCDIIEKKNIK